MQTIGNDLFIRTGVLYTKCNSQAILGAAVIPTAYHVMRALMLFIQYSHSFSFYTQTAGNVLVSAYQYPKNVNKNLVCLLTL